MATNAGGPNIVVLAGPNGAGKSTVAPALLKRALRVVHFVNADMIAHGLSGFAPQEVSLAAARIMRTRLDELAEARVDFAFETTLAGRSLAAWLRRRLDAGFAVRVAYLWLPSPEMAIRRVADRAARGGHDVSPETIVRRYERSLANLLGLYLPLATSWRVYDNSGPAPRLIAAGGHDRASRVLDPATWKRITETWA